MVEIRRPFTTVVVVTRAFQSRIPEAAFLLALGVDQHVAHHIIKSLPTLATHLKDSQRTYIH